MKKFIKFLLAVGSLAGLAAGGYYVYKNYIEKQNADLEDEFDEDEDFEDFDDESREYVSINITEEVTDAYEPAEELQETTEETVEEVTE